MRTTAPTIPLFNAVVPLTAVLLLRVSIVSSASSFDDIDLDAALSQYCEDNGGVENPGDSMASSFQVPILEGCRAAQSFREAVWTVSLKLAVPASAAEDFLRGSLMEEAVQGTEEEKRTTLERVERLFRRASSESPENVVLRDRILAFYIEWIKVDDFASRLVEMVQHDPDPRTLALHLAQGKAEAEDGLSIALAAALQKVPRDAELLAKLAKSSSSHALRAASYLGALQRTRLHASCAQPEREAVLAGNWLSTLLDAGLAESALGAYDDLSAEIQEAILDGRTAPLDDPFLLFQGIVSPEILFRSLCLAGSLSDPGSDEIGQSGLDLEPERRVPLDPDLCGCLRDDPYLERMVAPSSDDPFPLIVGADYFTAVTNGRVAPTVWLRVFVDWLVREKYAEAARDWYPMLLAQLEREVKEESPDLVLELLPPDVRDDYDRVRVEIQDLRDAMRRREEETKKSARDGARAMMALLPGPSHVQADVAATLISRSLGRPPILALDRRPIPAGADPVEETFENRRQRMDAWASRYRFPDGFWPSQVHQADRSVAALGWHDPAPLPTGPYGVGYSLIRSPDGGITWSRPLETSLSLGPGLEILQGSSLPLISEGALQIELMERGHGTDDESQWRTAWVTIPLPILEKDGDGDGLTDLLEEKLMTDPKRSDTDGDGLDDAEDPMPLIPLVPSDETSDLEAFLAALLPRVCHIASPTFLNGRTSSEAWTRLPEEDRLGRDRICGLVLDRVAFQSMMPGTRLLIVTKEEAERARQKFGAFEPIEILSFFMDRGHHRGFVRWKRGWLEETAETVRERGGWRVEVDVPPPTGPDS